MIVWGGAGGGTFYADGGRYDPSSNTWSAVANTQAPPARIAHVAVWTGTEMIVWGGTSTFTCPRHNDGGRYDPSANSWLLLPTAGAPPGANDATASWTGGQMLVFGGTTGCNAAGLAVGFSPSTSLWTSASTTNDPVGRLLHTSVWTGAEMIIFGGVSYSASTSYNDGRRYSPDNDNWTTLPATGAPSPRHLHSAVWTGTAMLVWGGGVGAGPATFFSDGAAYVP